MSVYHFKEIKTSYIKRLLCIHVSFFMTQNGLIKQFMLRTLMDFEGDRLFSINTPHNKYSLLRYYDTDCFSIWVFFHNHSRITGLQRKGEDNLTPRYHFHPLHNTQTFAGRLLQRAHLSTQLAARLEPLASESKSLTTKLCRN